MSDIILNIRSFLSNFCQGASGMACSEPYALTMDGFRASWPKDQQTYFNEAICFLNQANFQSAASYLGKSKVAATGDKSTLYYLLAWRAFLMDNIVQSLGYLRFCYEADPVGLTSYLMAKKPSAVPQKLLRFAKNVFPALHRLSKDGTNLHLEALSLVVKHAKNLPEFVNILDLGAGLGANGEAISLVWPDNNYQLTGVEASSTMFSICNKLAHHDTLHDSSINDFLVSNTKVYDLTIAIDSLSERADLNLQISLLADTVATEGYVLFGFGTSQEVELVKHKMRFRYPREQILEAVTKNGFKVVDTKEKHLQPEDNYLFVLCKKF